MSTRWLTQCLMESKVTSSNGILPHNTLLKQLQDFSSETGITFPRRVLDPCSLFWNILNNPMQIQYLTEYTYCMGQSWFIVCCQIFPRQGKFCGNWMPLLVIIQWFLSLINSIGSCSSATNRAQAHDWVHTEQGKSPALLNLLLGDCKKLGWKG